MLYLLQRAEEQGDRAGRRAPISERSAAYFERALLAADDSSRLAAVQKAVAHEPAVAQWALETVNLRSGNTVDALDDAAAWLSCRLVTELAAALIAPDDEIVEPGGIYWRLPALVARLNDLQQRATDFQGRLEHEKLESLKQLAYGASHEINNPLANIAARAQTLLEDEADSERQRKLLAIHRQAMRTHEMISDLMLFARPPKLKLAPCDLRRIVERAVDEHREMAAEREIQLVCEFCDQPIVMSGDDTQLAVAIGAVVTNAVEAVATGGYVHVALQQINLAGQRRAEIVIRDDGPGISPTVRRHMFDPFFSGREAGRGAGFGLSKCWRIVTDHGGQVVVNQPTSGGAEIAIHLLLPREEGMPTIGDRQC